MGFLRDAALSLLGLTIGWGGGAMVWPAPEVPPVVQLLSTVMEVELPTAPLDPVPVESEGLPPWSLALQIVPPQPVYITRGDLYEALARSSWPQYLWSEVVRIAMCESTLDTANEGDAGRALGLMQVRVDAHRDLAQQFNLRVLDDALAAAWLVYTRAGSFQPWSCW